MVFELDNEDGWPPVGTERVWAFSRGRDRYVIDNVPWFVRDLAVGDVVRAVSPDSHSHPVFQEVLRRSDHVTIRVICFRAGPLEGDLARAADPFVQLGVHVEAASQYGLLALDIGAEAPLDDIVAVLRAGQESGSWDYEEGRITQEWVDATSGEPTH